MTDLPVGPPVEPRGATGEPPEVIEGADVVLRRPHAADGAVLYPATHGDPVREAVWAYMGYGPWPDEAAMTEWIVSTIPSADPRWWTAVVDGRPVGMATIMNRDDTHWRAEIGHIWYEPGAQRTTVNTEVAYLLMKECFETLAARRVEWKADALNERSRIAALRLGFTYEGVFRNHMIVKGRNRDTVWFAMTDTEWPEARRRLERWLYETPREAGRPVESLSRL